MKRIAYLILIAILFMLFAGCGEDSPTEGNYNQTLVLSGQFSGWTYGDSLQLSLTDENGTNPQYFLASASIDAEGKFKLAAPAPPLEKLKPVTEIYNTSIYSSSSIIFSNPYAKFFRGFPVIMEASRYRGYVEWTDIHNVDQTAPTWKYYRAAYYYFDRDVEIKGSASCPACDGGYLEFNLTAKAGWNTFLFAINQNLIGSYENYKPIDGRYDAAIIRSAPVYTPLGSLIAVYPEN